MQLICDASETFQCLLPLPSKKNVYIFVVAMYMYIFVVAMWQHTFIEVHMSFYNGASFDTFMNKKDGHVSCLKDTRIMKMKDGHVSRTNGIGD